jgi:tRNA pseudouridine38-40 synthase
VAARTLRLTLIYDGGAYHGWQIQPTAPTVQGFLAEACGRVFGRPVKVVGASRTDAGVHALAQVASLTVESDLHFLAIRSAINSHLPPDIRVREAADAAPGFDARRTALSKRYLYLIDNGPVGNPLLRRYAWHVPQRLDLPSMRSALGRLRGKHDFSAFCAAAGRARTPTCTVYSARAVQRQGLVAVFLSADSFLHHMVRNIVGSLVEIGRGSREPEWMAELLEGRDRTRAGPTAPAQGLTLLRVCYPRDIYG